MSVTAERAGQPSPVSSDAKRYLAVDGLRGVAAIALLFTHVAMIQGLLGTKELGGRLAPSNLVGGFFAGGLQICAGVFFVVTGLFIYRPYVKRVITGQHRPGGGNFLRRALRLLPAYYLMYVVVLFTLNFRSIDSAWYVLRPILLLHIYDWGGWINGMEITWTVPDMAQFYLLLPVLAWVTHRFALRGATPRERAMRMMLPVPILILTGFAWMFVVRMENLGTRAIFWWPQGLLPEIAVGMALAIMMVLSKESPKDTPKLFRIAAARPHLFLGASVVVILINCARPFSEIGMDDYYSLPGVATFYVLLALLSLCAVLPLVASDADTRLIRAVFTNRAILYVSKVSYGVYLWHFAVMHLYLQPDAIFGGAQPAPLPALRGGAGFWELQIVTLIGALIFASLSYYLVERPVMEWGERHLRRKRRRKMAAARRPVASVSG